MFFVLAKILDFFINPLCWFLILLGISLLVRNSKVKKKLKISAFVVLFFFSNLMVYNFFSGLWTSDLKVKSEFPEIKIGVVLGGMLIHDPIHERAHFNENIDRLLQALPLLNEGKLTYLIISGGSGYLRYDEFSEAKELYKYLNQIGVNTERILLETQSNNTYQNALYTTNLIDSVFGLARVNHQVAIFTSALHMKRAKACFKKQGINTFEYATNPIDQKNKKFHWEEMILPRPDVMVLWYNLFHEIIGYVAYNIKGYI